MADQTSPSSSTEQAKVLPVASPEAADQLGRGLLEFLLPIVQECDDRVQGVFASQSALSEQIDALSAQLEKFVEESKTPALGPYVQKLANSRHRVSSINALLDRVMMRLDRINTMISTPDK